MSQIDDLKKGVVDFLGKTYNSLPIVQATNTLKDKGLGAFDWSKDKALVSGQMSPEEYLKTTPALSTNNMISTAMMMSGGLKNVGTAEKIRNTDFWNKVDMPSENDVAKWNNKNYSQYYKNAQSKLSSSP